MLHSWQKYKFLKSKLKKNFIRLLKILKNSIIQILKDIKL